MINTEYIRNNVLKEMFHALALGLSRVTDHWEVGRALEKLEKHLASAAVFSYFTV